MKTARDTDGTDPIVAVIALLCISMIALTVGLLIATREPDLGVYESSRMANVYIASYDPEYGSGKNHHDAKATIAWAGSAPVVRYLPHDCPAGAVATRVGRMVKMRVDVWKRDDGVRTSIVDPVESLGVLCGTIRGRDVAMPR